MENQEKSDKSENQKDKLGKGENAEGKNSEATNEKTQNQNWDQAQRRNQAGPRSYTDTSGIIKGETENGMERMEEKNPEDQKDLDDQNKK